MTFIVQLVDALAWPVAVAWSATIIARAYRDSFEDDDDA